MANGASRLFSVMQKTNVNTISELINLKVISLKPLTFSDGDRLVLTEQFCVLNDYIDKTKIQVGDTFSAVTLNDGQTYYINQIISSKNELNTYNNNMNKMGNNISSLLNKISKLENDYKALAQRVSALENKG